MISMFNQRMYFLRAGGRWVCPMIFMLGMGWLPALQAQIKPIEASKAPRNLIVNGGFEKVITFQNLYDGVDGSGNIRVPRAAAPVYVEGSSVSNIPSASSPCVADVNGDGLPDLVVGSSLGFLYWYPNVGKKGEPAFEQGHLVQTYLGTTLRIYVADWNGDGKLDVLFGNIEGKVYLLPNVGSAREPKWVIGMDKPRWFAPPPAPPVQAACEVMRIGDGKEPLTVGNYSAPVFSDWNGDGFPDLIVGEGSYSANSVRIWLNTGTKGNPAFKPENKFYLAFGEGREQLTPTVYDWNGDGLPDLLVGDREGRVSLFLGTKESIRDPKKIEPVAFTKYITVGGREKLDSMVSICACDLNQDGIPDLVYGMASGGVMVAYGKGKREDPELGEAVALKGVDAAKDFKQPLSWDNRVLDFATDVGGPYYGTAPLPEVVSMEDQLSVEVKEGKRAFHLSWFEKFWGWWFSSVGHYGWVYIHEEAGERPPGHPTGWVEGGYTMSVPISSFIMGMEYEFSLWKKGNNMHVEYTIFYAEVVPNPHGAQAGPPRSVHHHYSDRVQLTSAWNQYRKTHRLAGTKEKHYDGNGKKIDGTLSIRFFGTGDAWLDDVKLIEVVK